MIKILSQIKVLPVLEIDTNVDPERLIESLLEGNITIVEITLRNKLAFNHLELVTKKFSEVIVGMGTVLNIDQMKQSIDCLAHFAGSTGYELKLAKFAKKIEFPYLPGVSSSSDIMSLLNLDFNIFKFFPAYNSGGIKYLKTLNGPFPNVKFCPTGGINEKNYYDWMIEKNLPLEVRNPYDDKIYSLEKRVVGSESGFHTGSYIIKK